MEAANKHRASTSMCAPLAFPCRLCRATCLRLIPDILIALDDKLQCRHARRRLVWELQACVQPVSGRASNLHIQAWLRPQPGQSYDMKSKAGPGHTQHWRAKHTGCSWTCCHAAPPTEQWSTGVSHPEA